MARGIRPYGPGKFNTLLDKYLYELTLEGGADQEASYPEGGGWYGYVDIAPNTIDLIREIAEADGDQLTRDEEKLIGDSTAVILFERSDGIVESDWYDRLTDAEEAWDQIEREVHGEEDEEDVFSEEEMREGYVITDTRGRHYEVSHQGRHFGVYDDMDEALEAIHEHMESEQYWPNVYHVNDHGNIDLLDASGNSIQSRV
jgi:hypothetical protein